MNRFEFACAAVKQQEEGGTWRFELSGSVPTGCVARACVSALFDARLAAFQKPTTRRKTGMTSGTPVSRQARKRSPWRSTPGQSRSGPVSSGKYRAEMATPDNRRILDLLAALSHHADFSVGCYCVDESHCHRSVLRELLTERGASVR